MKVLFVIPNMEAGGAERVMLNLLRHIDRGRFEPHLALLDVRGAHLESVPPDVTIHALGASAARFAVLPIAKLCWQIRPRAILSILAYMNAAVIAARPLLPKPVRLIIREGTRTVSPEVTRNRVRLWSYKQFYRRADVVVCQSEFMKQEMQREFGLPSEKLARIYNPVDIDLISRLACDGQNPFQAEGPHLVAVGRLSQEKTLDLLLSALPLVRVTFPGVRLTVVGQGQLEAALKNRANQLGLASCVRFAGFQANPYPFLRHAHALVLSSRYEGLPNAVLEALALGTFAVSTNCTGAMREIAGTTRRLRIAAEHTPESLASAIGESLLESLAAPKPNGPEPEFEARFGLSPVMAQYERLLYPSGEEPLQTVTAETRPGFKFAAR
jgi:glycosyltransferase involved in cell wall biosynthesis